MSWEEGIATAWWEITAGWEKSVNRASKTSRDAELNRSHGAAHIYGFKWVHQRLGIQGLS